MYCEKCGKQLPDNAKFCDGCGNKTIIPVKEEKVETDTINAKESLSENSKPTKKRAINKFNAFVAILTAALAIVLIIVIAARPKPAKSSVTKANYDFKASTPVNKTINDDKQFLSAQSWQEMSFILDGVEYQLPLEISELEKYGWKLDYSEEKVEPGKCVDFSASKELSYIKGTLCNFESTKTESQNCKIRSIRFNWANGIFPQDIMILSTGIADVYDAYGDADYFDEYNKSYIWGDKMGYLGGNGAYIRFNFDNDDIISFADLGCEIN